MINKAKGNAPYSPNGAILIFTKPREPLEDVLDKLKIEFAFGIKSCWLVIPPLELITVYSNDNLSKSFARPICQEVFDEVLDIKIPLTEIFSKKYSSKISYFFKKSEKTHQFCRHFSTCVVAEHRMTVKFRFIVLADLL
ncbi:MAG: hypothetical protein DRR08_02640 [Candidatus Parabeggiatoa sp. nov. 2]|nr:MAG: hypothetical protein B6247_00880 [Beggiatoa sp. 4572_84]RKZ63770.1 MAG: hypothetical protein DRR08_02640 [Gammaproteobacteria bacterium]